MYYDSNLPNIYNKIFLNFEQKNYEIIKIRNKKYNLNIWRYVLSGFQKNKKNI